MPGEILLERKEMKLCGPKDGCLVGLRLKLKIDDNKPKAVTQPTLLTFIVTKRLSMEEETSRFAALDRFSFQKIDISNFIQKSLRIKHICTT